MTKQREPKDIDIVFDFDGVICNNNDGDYVNAKPYQASIDNINKVYDMGYHVIIFTARYGKRDPGNQYQRGYEEALVWLRKHGVKFHELRMGKPAGDIYVDDKAVHVRGAMGDIDWDNNFWPRLKKTQYLDKYNQPLDKNS